MRTVLERTRDADKFASSKTGPLIGCHVSLSAVTTVDYQTVYNGRGGMIKKIWVQTSSLFLLVVYVAVLPFVVPLLSIGLIHYKVWQTFKKRQYGAALLGFLLGCLPIDVGLVLMTDWAYTKYVISN
jgi:hypothetical protein